MGVSGSGKTLVGRLLAQRLDVLFVDGDDLHPEANVTAMASGTPLTDEQRWPWLDRVGQWLAEHDAGVVACSALGRRHRDRLRSHAAAAVFLHLDGPAEVISERMSGRTHFMPETLLESQMAALEPLADDERGVVLSVLSEPTPIVDGFLEWADRAGEDTGRL